MNTNEKLPTVESKSEYWAHHISAWKDSGLNIREYCELEDLSKNAFGYWRRKLNTPKPPDDGFVELKLNSTDNVAVIHIRLRRGIELGIVPGTDTRYLGELVNVLESCQ
jgi:hypothetical protein